MIFLNQFGATLPRGGAQAEVVRRSIGGVDTALLVALEHAEAAEQVARLREAFAALAEPDESSAAALAGATAASDVAIVIVRPDRVFAAASGRGRIVRHRGHAAQELAPGTYEPRLAEAILAASRPLGAAGEDLRCRCMLT